jgi:hypothetical protein
MLLSVDDILSEIGGYQIFFTFFGALVVNNELLSPVWSDVIGIVLIMANMGIVVYLIQARWVDIKAYWSDGEDAVAEHKMERKVAPAPA